MSRDLSFLHRHSVLFPRRTAPRKEQKDPYTDMDVAIPVMLDPELASDMVNHSDWLGRRRR